MQKAPRLFRRLSAAVKRCSVADWLPRGCDEREKSELFAGQTVAHTTEQETGGRECIGPGD